MLVCKSAINAKMIEQQKQVISEFSAPLKRNNQPARFVTKAKISSNMINTPDPNSCDLFRVGVCLISGLCSKLPHDLVTHCLQTSCHFGSFPYNFFVKIASFSSLLNQFVGFYGCDILDQILLAVNVSVLLSVGYPV